MTTFNRRRRLVVAAVALSLVAAACGDDEDEPAAAGDDPTTTATEAEAGGDAASADLSSCPDPIVVQTDWFPEPEHGGLYQLIGPDGEADADNGIYSGPIGDTGANLEIRVGGPFLGGQSVTAQMYQDEDLFMGYIATDESIKFSGEQPTISVVSPLDVSPQILMWDPEAFPEIETFEDIGATGAPVLYFEGSSYMDFLVGKGLIEEDQIDASYDGSPTRFVTEEVFQQGFASAEPYKYENEIDEWGKPVEFLLIDESGFEIYPSSLAMRPEVVEESAACLEGLVPAMQQAQVDYMADPEPVNGALLSFVEEIDDFWVLSEGGNADAVQKMLDLGLVSNGSDDVLGNFDLDRVQALIDDSVAVYEELGLDTFDPAVTAEDVVSNEFIDDSIGLP